MSQQLAQSPCARSRVIRHTVELDTIKAGYNPNVLTRASQMEGSLLEDRLWEKFYSDAQQALSQGQHGDALRDFQAAAKLAEEFGAADARLAKSLAALGATYSLLKQFDLAEQQLERSLGLVTKYRGSDHPDSLVILKNLALVTFNLNKLEQADKYFQQAISIYEHIQPEHPQLDVLREKKKEVLQKMEQRKSRERTIGKSETAPPAKAPSVAKGPGAHQPVPAADMSKQRVTAEMVRPEFSQKANVAKTGANNAPAMVRKPGVGRVDSSSGDAGGAGAAAGAGPSFPGNLSDPDALSGFVIENRYQVYGRIGEGGMSAIYRGKHLLMDRPVAIKILHKHLTASEKVRERFKKEARTASMLQHPNIVAVHDFGEAQGFFYLIMDFVDGISLNELIRKLERIPPQRCVPIIRQICDGLQHAHENGILHRDLKPSNIMLVKQGSNSDFVKIVDFGIAKFIHEAGDEHALQLTQTGETVGSPLYMSPEQCRGEKLDARSDIYSLGCLTYKALAGVPPFSGNNQIDVYIKHTQTQAPPFHLTSPQTAIPPELENIVLKTLEKTPDARWSSMEELRNALADFAAKQGW